MKRQPLTRALIDEFFIILDGKVLWKNDDGKKRAGKEAGWADEDGYIYIGLVYRLYQAHRIIFTYHYGFEPSLVDHIDRNPRNNDPENLREADKVINSINRGLQSNNTSGVRGVGWSKASRKWRAYIKCEGVTKHLGVFDEFEDAASARSLAESELWNARDINFPQ